MSIMKKTLSLILLLVSFQASAQWYSAGTGIATNDFVIGFAEYQNQTLAYTYPDPSVYTNVGGNWSIQLPPLPLAAGVHKLEVIDSVLYAMSYAAGTGNRVYYYDGSAWQALGGAFANPGNLNYPSLYDMLEYHDTIFVCGEFSRVGTDTISGIAKWNGTAWEEVRDGLHWGMAPYTSTMYPHQLFEFQSELYVIGNFVMAGIDSVNGIARWNGTSWSKVGNGFNKVGYGMGEFNGNLYAGGEFTSASGTSVSCIAKWDGTNWLDPGFSVQVENTPGVHAFVHSFLSVPGALFVAGGFDHVYLGATSYQGQGVFMYNGFNVDTLLGGVNSDVEALMQIPGGIRVGGGFSLAGGIVVDKVADYYYLLGVEEIGEKQFVVYPTYFENSIRVQGAFDQSSYRYELRDITGKLIDTGILKNEITFKSLPSGVYFASIVKNGRLVQVEKLVKK